MTICDERIYTIRGLRFFPGPALQLFLFFLFLLHGCPGVFLYKPEIWRLGSFFLGLFFFLHVLFIVFYYLGEGVGRGNARIPSLLLRCVNEMKLNFLVVWKGRWVIFWEGRGTCFCI